MHTETHSGVEKFVNDTEIYTVVITETGEDSNVLQDELGRLLQDWAKKRQMEISVGSVHKKTFHMIIP